MAVQLPFRLVSIRRGNGDRCVRSHLSRLYLDSMESPRQCRYALAHLLLLLTIPSARSYKTEPERARKEAPLHHRSRSIIMHDHLHHKDQMTMRIRYVEYWCLHIYEYIHVCCMCPVKKMFLNADYDVSYICCIENHMHVRSMLVPFC